MYLSILNFELEIDDLFWGFFLFSKENMSYEFKS